LIAGYQLSLLAGLMIAAFRLHLLLCGTNQTSLQRTCNVIVLTVFVKKL